MFLQYLLCVVDCCIISFLTHRIYRLRGRKAKTADDDRRRGRPTGDDDGLQQQRPTADNNNDQRRRRQRRRLRLWRGKSVVLCYFYPNNVTNTLAPIVFIKRTKKANDERRLRQRTSDGDDAKTRHFIR